MWGSSGFTSCAMRRMRQRLVEKEELWLADQRLRQQESLLLATREAPERAICVSAGID